MTWMLWIFISMDVSPVFIAEYQTKEECEAAYLYAEAGSEHHWCIPTSPFTK